MKILIGIPLFLSLLRSNSVRCSLGYPDIDDTAISRETPITNHLSQHIGNFSNDTELEKRLFRSKKPEPSYRFLAQVLVENEVKEIGGSCMGVFIDTKHVLTSISCIAKNSVVHPFMMKGCNKMNYIFKHEVTVVVRDFRRPYEPSVNIRGTVNYNKDYILNLIHHDIAVVILDTQVDQSIPLKMCTDLNRTSKKFLGMKRVDYFQFVSKLPDGVKAKNPDKFGVLVLKDMKQANGSDCKGPQYNPDSQVCVKAPSKIPRGLAKARWPLGDEDRGSPLILTNKKTGPVCVFGILSATMYDKWKPVALSTRFTKVASAKCFINEVIAQTRVPGSIDTVGYSKAPANSSPTFAPTN